MREECRGEVDRLHRFIGDWLAGRVEQSDWEFLRFREALAEEFVIIDPTGRVQDKEAISSSLWRIHGSRSEPFRIEIREFKLLPDTGPACLANYQEWQIGTDSNARISTALLRRRGGLGRLEWVYVQETWMPDERAF